MNNRKSAREMADRLLGIMDASVSQTTYRNIVDALLEWREAEVEYFEDELLEERSHHLDE